MNRRLAGALTLALGACSHHHADPTGTGDPRLRPSTCRPPTTPPPYRLVDLVPGLRVSLPTAIARIGTTYWITQQTGQVVRIAEDRSSVVLDVSEELMPPTNEGGLIGFALSPDFEKTGEAFFTYTAKSDHSLFQTIIAKYTSRDGGRSFDPATKQIIFALDRDFEAHNGGKLVFGPDRLLYAGIGDGSWEDPLRRVPDPSQPYGKILTFDVLAGSTTPVVFAKGFRNPWCFSFDDSGRLWLGDVGHMRWEEIDIVTRGGDYGWPFREGTHCLGEPPCEVPGAVDPVHEYPHVDGFAVMGGLVYRGHEPSLLGRYVFGDFVTGRMWALDAANPGPSTLLVDSGSNISGFGEDEDGTILVLDLGGRILRLEASPAITSEVASLSSLGCLDPTRPGEVDEALIPYRVNAELWSDGLAKRRWFSLPAERAVDVSANGNFDIPVGSLFLKEMSSNGRRIETRMLVRDPDTGWEGFTFKWNEEQTDAVLANDAETVDVDGSPWTLPSRAQCFACHRKSEGGVAGFEDIQLDRDGQLSALSARGVFQPAIEHAHAPPLVDPRRAALPAEARARSYLHANCSLCHGADGTPQGMIDLRASTSVADMHVVCRPATFVDGITPLVVAPGDPAGSFLVQRMSRRDDLQMPPLGTHLVDTVARDAVADWIASLTTCP